VTRLANISGTGRPLGEAEFIEGLEKSMGRRLVPQKGGRPEKPAISGRQAALIFEP
jgi:hypothetical protein